MGNKSSTRIQYLFDGTLNSCESIHSELAFDNKTFIFCVLFWSEKENLISFVLTDCAQELYERTSTLTDIIVQFSSGADSSKIGWDEFVSGIKSAVTEKRFLCHDKKSIVFNITDDEGVGHNFYIKLEQRGLRTPEQIVAVVFSLSRSLISARKEAIKLSKEASSGNQQIENQNRILDSLNEKINLLDSKISAASIKTKKKRVQGDDEDEDDSDSDDDMSFEEPDTATVSFPGLRIVANLKHLRKVMEKKKVLRRYYPLIDDAINALSNQSLDAPTIIAAKDKQMEEWVNTELDLKQPKERPDMKTLVTVFTVSNYWKKLIDGKQGKSSKAPKPKIRSAAYDYLMENAESWAFDAMKLYELSKQRPLQVIGEYVFDKFRLFQTFDIPLDNLRNFLFQIETNYGLGPYHTSTHASDVLQVVYYVLTQGGLARYLKDEEIFAVILAAIVHDYRHPATNNNFQTRVASDVAMTYNDKSVLENFHVSEAFKLMRDEDKNIMINLGSDQKTAIRADVIDLVLATDMAQHSKILYNFQTMLQGSRVDFDKKNNVLLLLKLVMKIGDVSNPARPMNIYIPWALRISEEQFAQGDKERELGMKVSALMDRHTTKVGAGQLAFIEYIVLPLYRTFSKSITEFEEIVENHVESNLTFWQENKDSFETLDDVRRHFELK